MQTCTKKTQNFKNDQNQIVNVNPHLILNLMLNFISKIKLKTKIKTKVKTKTNVRTKPKAIPKSKTNPTLTFKPNPKPKLHLILNKAKRRVTTSKKK